MTARARQALGAFVLVALLGPISVDALWVSDEERVADALDAMEQALGRRDADGVVEWFAEDVTVARPIPGFPVRGTLADALRSFLARATRVSLDRDATEIVFPDESTERNGSTEPDEDGASVTTHGLGAVELPGYPPGAFHFDLELKLRRASDGRFVLQSVERVTIESPFR